jgi:hypothetical protein
VAVPVRLEYQPELDLVPLAGLVAGGEDRQLSPKVALDGALVPLFEAFRREDGISAERSGVCALTGAGRRRSRAIGRKGRRFPRGWRRPTFVSSPTKPTFTPRRRDDRRRMQAL